MSAPVFLRGKEVTLRPVSEDHVPFLADHLNDPEIWQSLDRHRPTAPASVREWYETRRENDDIVDLLVYADGSPVGFVSLSVLNRVWRNCSVTFWVAPDHRGAGYATDALAELIDYAFADFGQHKILAHVFEFNAASFAVLEKLGFTEEGVHREEVYADGRYWDLHSLGLLDRDWEKP